MTDQTGKIEFTYSDAALAKILADAFINSGKTCDEDTWARVMAWEAVRALRGIGALK